MSNKLTYKEKEYWAENGKESEYKLMSASAYIGDSIPAVSLPVDTLTAVVRDYDTQPRVFAAEGRVLTAGGRVLVTRLSDRRLDLTYRYGDDVLYHHNGDLVGKFRLETIKRTGRYEYQLNCVSTIGLLLTSYHYGGLYTGQTVAEVIAEIVGGVVSYTLDAALGAVPVYGLLRKGTRRDNLRDLLFAVGGQVRKDTVGELHIVPMTSGTPYQITADEFYQGGSVTGGNPATAVNVTEHSFMALPGDQEVTLYDGASFGEELIAPSGKTVTGVLVEFPDPMHDLSVQNAEILESGVNYAVISNSPAAVLTGKQYTHVTRIVSRRKDAGGTPNVVTSSACELVNLLNSELVADRLWAYYASAKTVEADIVVDGQKPGDAVTFVDPFGDETTGYIADMELTMSSIIKARTTLVSGYIPPGSGNYYSNVMVITSSQDVTIPAESKGKVLVVAIGGGDGGGLGEAGEQGGWDATTTSYGTAGKGGNPGTPGAGGKIYVGTVPVKPGQVISVVIGKGGKGATKTSEAETGGDTSFGNLITSANGYDSPDGYSNIITGDIYATPGVPGIQGGAGVGPNYPNGESVTYKGVTYTPGAPGADDDTARGGRGGGPAAGANGYQGGDGYMASLRPSGTQAQGGDGGLGATPVKADNGQVPGAGGGAGHGGGGGGAGGPASGGTTTPARGIGGDGGDPGEGGDGADGVLIIYY